MRKKCRKGALFCLTAGMAFFLTVLPDVRAAQEGTESVQPETESEQLETESMQPETENEQPETESVQLETESMQPETESEQPDAESMQTGPDYIYGRPMSEEERETVRRAVEGFAGNGGYMPSYEDETLYEYNESENTFFFSKSSAFL